MWRERALRAEAAMAKPPESPAVATMFQQHAASLREEVKATIEAALKEDRARGHTSQRRPAATPRGGAAARRRRRRRRRRRSKGPTTRRPRRCRPGARPRRRRGRGPRGDYGEDLRGRRRLRAAHGEAARAGREARGRPGAHPGGPGRVPARIDGAGPRAPDVRPPAGAAAAAYIRRRAPFVYTPPRAGLPADEPGPAGVVGGRDAEFEGLLKFINARSHTFYVLSDLRVGRGRPAAGRRGARPAGGGSERTRRRAAQQMRKRVSPEGSSKCGVVRSARRRRSSLISGRNPSIGERATASLRPDGGACPTHRTRSAPRSVRDGRAERGRRG